MSRDAAEGFAARLREGTRADHEAAEASGFVAALLDGRLGVAAYADLLSQTHLVYEVLEECARSYDGHPEVAPFLDPALERVPSLEADLAHLLGPSWRERREPVAATQRYRDRLREVSATWPAGLVAHHYLRYLGDLSGGQVMGRLLSRTYELGSSSPGAPAGDETGVSFYTFTGIAKPKPYKDAYRAALDAAPWDADEQERVVEEVRVAFRLNADLFADLGARHLPGAAA